MPSGDAEGDGQRAGRVRRPDGESVHGGARKRRQIDGTVRRLGKDAPGRLLQRDALRPKRLHALEDEALGLLDRQELGHDRRIPYARRIGSAAVISVVVPVHDEERTVALLYDELESALQPLGRSWEAVFVDDGSTDGSFASLTRLHNAHDNVRVIRLRRNFGKAAALAAGFAQAEGDVVVTIDADLQDDPAEIPRLLAKLDEGFDLVSGWKAHRRDPLTRRVLSKIFNWVTGRVSGLRLHDLNCGLKAYRAEVVRGLPLYGELHRFIPVLAHYRGHRIAELPVNHRPREHGRSRYGVERYVRGFLDLLTVSFIGRYRYRPLHLFGGLGLLLGALGFGVLLYLTVLKIDGHAIGQRPLLFLGVLLMVVGLQFFSLGLISELITSQHEERAGARERTELHVDEVLS
jgi:glycosyltransferase involved in cell wall biosynthesis